jgi:Flp pilus assembly pilin Flp
VRARTGRWARARARSSRPSSGPRRLLDAAGSLGASSIEYGLLIALIAAVLCVGVGVTIKTVFGDTISCLVAEFGGDDATDSTCDVVTPHTVPGGNHNPSPLPASSTSPKPKPSPSASPSPTPTPAP